MGLIAELVRVVTSSLKTKAGAPGQAVVVEGEGLGGSTATAEVYGPLGVFSRPPKGSKVLMLPLAGGKTRVVVAGVNYQITLDCGEGETIVYSTDASGQTVRARIALDAAGNIDLNGNTKRLVTADELQTALTTLAGAINTLLGAKLDGTGTPGTLACSISAARTTTIRTGG